MLVYRVNYVAGVDQSARHTGVCVLSAQGEVLVLDTIQPKKLKDQARLAFIRAELNALLADYTLKALVMEGYSYGSVNKKFLLGEVGAVIKLVAYDMGATLYEASPSQLKKFVTGRGSSDKEAMLARTRAEWGLDLTDDNLADAFGLAQIGREVLWPTSTRRHRLDVVKKIKAGKRAKKRKSRIVLDRGSI